MFARLIDGEWQPYSLAQLVEDSGGPAVISLPQPFDDDAAAAHGMARIGIGERPEETAAYSVAYDGIADVDGRPVYQWKLEPKPLDTIKATLRAAVNARRDRMQDGTVQTPFGRFDCNERSRVFIHGGVTEAMIRQASGDTTPLTFTTADNEDVALSPAQMIGAGRMVLGYISTVHFHARALKDTIDAAEDHDALDSIDLEKDWM